MTKRLLFSVVALTLSSGTLLAQGGAKPLATHGSMRLSSDKVTMCSTENDASCLLFQSNDLAEAKPATVNAVMAKEFTDGEVATLTKARSYKSATVTCSAVAVYEVPNQRTGGVMTMANATGCVLNDLQARPSGR